jgi:hypothetical protein
MRSMTKLLKEAFERASQLPEAEQDALAALLLAEIEDEKRWQEAFRRGEAKLTELAEEALEEFRAGRTTPLDRLLFAG